MNVNRSGVGKRQHTLRSPHNRTAVLVKVGFIDADRVMLQAETIGQHFAELRVAGFRYAESERWYRTPVLAKGRCNGSAVIASAQKDTNSFCTFHSPFDGPIQ